MTITTYIGGHKYDGEIHVDEPVSSGSDVSQDHTVDHPVVEEASVEIVEPPVHDEGATTEEVHEETVNNDESAATI